MKQPKDGEGRDAGAEAEIPPEEVAVR